jgi:RNA polymerase sigma factor (sigma-70 family)
MKMTDSELLRSYARDRSEAAFGDLVRRHVNLVYSAALRQVNGDTHLAEDVTQSVFADLARKAAGLGRHTSLTAWLYTSTRYAAGNVRRAGQRRTVREQEANTMSTILSSTNPEPDWAEIRPLLEDAMHELDGEDREAVLLRHFENRPYAEIAARFDLTENAARMRVERALEKLHDILSRRGVTSTSAALAGLLAANAVGAAPTNLAAKVASAALTGAATAGGVAALVAQIVTGTTAKLALGVAAAVVVAGVALHLVSSRHASAANPQGTVASGASGNVNAAVAAVPVVQGTSISDEVLRQRAEQTRLWNDSHAAPAAIHLQATNLDQVFHLYQDLANRTVLCPSPRTNTFTVTADAGTREEALAVLTKALTDAGFTCIPDGEKFVMIVPTDHAEMAVPRSVGIRSSAGDEAVSNAVEINMPGSPVSRVALIYAELAGWHLDPSDFQSVPGGPPGDPPFVPVGASISLHSRTPLTKKEAIYALGTLLRWENVKLVREGTNMMRAVPVSQ